MTPPITPDPAAEAVSDLRETLLKACFDPGMVIGPRGGRTTDEWRADACAASLVPLLADIAALRTRAEEAEARAERIDAKLGELNAKVAECLPPAETLVAEREAATADRDRLADEVVRLGAIVAKLTSGCPWDGPARETAKFTPEMPCPVCGDLGTFNAEATTASRCVSHAQSRKEWRALTATGGNDDSA